MATADGRRFNSLVEPHLEALYRAAFRLVRNEADAEDLVQETCVRAIRRLADLDESQSIKSWLLTVLQNLFLDGVRRVQCSPVTNACDGDIRDSSACTDPNPEEQASIDQREDRLHIAWSKLDAGQQILLALRAEEYSISEIATITGIPTDALYARIYRARSRLAQYLNEHTQHACEKRLEIAK